MDYIVATEKRCPKCRETKPREAFNRAANRKDGLQVHCKSCLAAGRAANSAQACAYQKEYRDTRREALTDQRAARRAADPAKYRAREKEYKARTMDQVIARNRAREAWKINAIPGWSELADVKVLYAKAKELSTVFGVALEVDHIVPLKSPHVCGLHCPDNLQLLAADVNVRKGNRHWPDMPDEPGVSARPY